MPKLTEQEVNQVVALHAQYEELFRQRRDIEYHLEQLGMELCEVREEQRLVLQQIENIQGEIDWG
jgi:hypothetical protein